jgi:hypothetical protein
MYSLGLNKKITIQITTNTHYFGIVQNDHLYDEMFGRGRVSTFDLFSSGHPKNDIPAFKVCQDI